MINGFIMSQYICIATYYLINIFLFLILNYINFIYYVNNTIFDSKFLFLLFAIQESLICNFLLFFTKTYYQYNDETNKLTNDYFPGYFFIKNSKNIFLKKMNQNTDMIFYIFIDILSFFTIYLYSFVFSNFLIFGFVFLIDRKIWFFFTINFLLKLAITKIMAEYNLIFFCQDQAICCYCAKSCAFCKDKLPE